MAEERDDKGAVEMPGGYLDWTDAELDELAAITPAVIADAMADARRLPQLDRLLRAREVTGGQPDNG